MTNKYELSNLADLAIFRRATKVPSPIVGKALKLRKQLMATELGQEDTFILCLGDSNTVGLYAGINSVGSELYVSNGHNRSTPAAISRELGKRGFPVSYSAFFGDGNLSARASGYYPSFHPEVTLSSDVSAPATNFTLGGCLWRQSAGTTGIGFNPSVDVDTFDWFYAASNAASTATEEVDSGGATSVNQQIGSGFQLVRRTKAAGSPGSHTLKIGRSAGNITFCGAIGRNSTKKQVYVMEAGFSSATIDYLFATAGGDRPWRGMNFAVALAGMGLCHGAIIEFGINELTDLVPVETYKSNYRTLLSGLTSAGIDCILQTFFPLNPSVVDATLMEAYIVAIYDIAAEFNLPVIDKYNWLGENYQSVLDAGLRYDSRHLSGFGYTACGHLAVNALLGTP